jgi:putative FmdB family regulatory protein
LPTYEYACNACGHRLEAVQSFSDEPLTECPECGSALRKVYGAVGIVLKGSGFYKTDSRAAARAGSGGNGSGSKKADDASGGSSSTESTPQKDAAASGGDAASNGNSKGMGDGKGRGDGKGAAATPAATTAS